MTVTGLASAIASRTRRQSLARRLVGSMPGLALGFGGSIVWAVAMAAGVAASLLLSGWQTPGAILQVAVVYAAGGALAFPLAFTTAGLLGGRLVEQRLAGALLAFTVITIGCTALVYAIDYCRYEWHGDPFTTGWAVEVASTIAGALGQFAISGIRMYFPMGFAALLLVSLWFAPRTG